ncbi:homoserine dehydrogenase [Azospirillum sp. YIM B02556]|uniref:Homoserine dehydrogenase n=1 Tax=Azospirillum endophyticum TaxID=2800326 RepID=A0ABS1FDP2_9PROT|nr:homoserine dehydrogenase [Azospirillum endophyticum]MBK1841458.1 homoserine dehydrogenase [Azospirillum endophyticum]
MPNAQQAPLKIAVAGLGTVGAGVLKLLETQGSLIEQRCGRRIEVVAVSARSKGKDRGVALSRVQWFDDPVAMAAQSGADLVVELIGGSEGPARDTVATALETGRHVVTANKALLAIHGTEIAQKAEARGLAVAFEAAVAGGIPIIKGLREGLAANSVSEIHGILNGTCNYILTEMRTTGRDFADVLADAQDLGYAEADPSFDVDGVDAAHKLAILASVAFGTAVDFASVFIEGIRQVAAVDFDYADQLGFRIKLLGIARRTDAGIEQRVHPCMVPKTAPIASVDGVFNAVVAQADFADRVLFVGRGAGAGPTASAVVADLIDIARGRSTPIFGVSAGLLGAATPSPMEARRGAYYVRLMVKDRPGVIADIAAAMRDQGVSMEQFLQRGRSPDEGVPVVLTTHDTDEASMQRALATIAASDTVLEPPRMIRIEQF